MSAKRAGKRNVVTYDHDGLIAALLDARDRTDRTRVAEAFAVGLRAKRLDWRSPLGSYAFHLNHPRHALVPFDPSGGTAGCLECEVCSFFSREGKPEMEIDFDHWAEVRTTSTVENFHIPAYAYADLKQFAEVASAGAIPPADEGDWELLRTLLERIGNLPPAARLGDLDKAAAGAIKGNKHTRQQVLEILGFCGILTLKDRPSVLQRFFCNDPNQRFHSRDWAYPTAGWSGADGIDPAAVAFWFPAIAR